MVLDVPRPAWNDVVMAATVFGLDMEPNSPEDLGGSSTVEICGSWDKLQLAYNHCTRKGDRPKLVYVAGSLPLDSEI